jgi:hypothetical protein
MHIIFRTIWSPSWLGFISGCQQQLGISWFPHRSIHVRPCLGMHTDRCLLDEFYDPSCKAKKALPTLSGLFSHKEAFVQLQGRSFGQNRLAGPAWSTSLVIETIKHTPTNHQNDERAEYQLDGSTAEGEILGARLETSFCTCRFCAQEQFCMYVINV